MNDAILIYGETLGWRRLVKHKKTTDKRFDFFVSKVKHLGYHLWTKESSAAMWGYPVLHTKSKPSKYEP